jgi:hypothetical protein
MLRPLDFSQSRSNLYGYTGKKLIHIKFIESSCHECNGKNNYELENQQVVDVGIVAERQTLKLT